MDARGGVGDCRTSSAAERSTLCAATVWEGLLRRVESSAWVRVRASVERARMMTLAPVALVNVEKNERGSGSRTLGDETDCELLAQSLGTAGYDDRLDWWS